MKHPPQTRFVIGVTVLATLGGAFAAANAAVDSGPWPMFHRDPAHTAFTSLAPPTTGSIAWSAALSDTVEYSSPVISSHGLILLGDQGKELWAFTQAGTPRWHYRTNGNIRYGSAAVTDDGKVLIGSGDGKLYALDLAGGLLWTAATGGAIKTSPAVAPDGTIYVGSDDARLWAFHPNGSLKWTYATGDTVRSSPALAPDGTIFFGSNDGYLRALHPDGTLRWSAATGGAIRGAPAVFRNRVVFGSADGFLYSLRTDGEFDFAAYTGENLRSSPAIGITGKIYIGMDTKIACFHDDGDPCYEFETGARVQSTPAVYANAQGDSLDVVLCGSDTGLLYCLKAGTLQWTANLGAPVRSSPAIGPQGLAYVGALNGRIYAIGSIVPGAVEVTRPGAIRLAVAPNPASGQVALRIENAPASMSRPVSLYDLCGRRVRALRPDLDGSVSWDGRDDEGHPLPAGSYWAAWSDGSEQATARFVLVR